LRGFDLFCFRLCFILLLLQLEVCLEDMKRKGFSSEYDPLYTNRWLEVICALCGSKSDVDETSSARSSGQDGQRLQHPTEEMKTECPANFLQVNAEVTLPSSAYDDTVKVEHSAPVGTEIKTGPFKDEFADTGIAMHSLLLREQPPMIDRMGKNLGVAAIDTFIEVRRMRTFNHPLSSLVSVSFVADQPFQRANEHFQVIDHQSDIASVMAARNVKLSTTQG